MKKYLFYEFYSGAKMASNKGTCQCMLNTETGEITATEIFGLMGYRDHYKYNINDTINIFPYTLQDRAVIKARQLMA